MTSSKSVTIEDARRLSRAGKWVPNPRARQHGQAAQIFLPDYSIHWRPNPRLPEHQQYALVESLT